MLGAYEPPPTEGFGRGGVIFSGNKKSRKPMFAR